MTVKNLSHYELRSVKEDSFNTTPNDPALLPIEILPGTRLDVELGEQISEEIRGDALAHNHYLISSGWTGIVESELYPDDTRLFEYIKAGMRSSGNSYIGDVDDQITNSADNGSHFYARLGGTSSETDWTTLGLTDERWVNFSGGTNADGAWRVADILSSIDIDGTYGGDEAWTPASLSNKVLWLDASDLVGTVADGDEVTSWADKSGNGYNATGSAGSAPTLDVDGFNGRPTLSFDGTELLNTSAMSISGEYTFFAVSNHADAGSIQPIFCDKNNMRPALLARVSNIDMVYCAYNDSDSNVGYTFTTTIKSRNDSIMSVVCSDGQYPDLFINGDDIVEGTTSGLFSSLNNPISAIRIGKYGANYLTGDIAEIIIINSALSDADREKVEGYLAHKYGLESQLPSAHAYDDAIPMVSGTEYIGGAKKVAASGDYAYVTAYDDDSLYIFDVTSTTPAYTGKVSSGYLAGASGLCVSGNYVYVACETSDSLVIVDATVKSTPTIEGILTGSANYLNGAVDVDVSGDYAFVASNVSDALAIIDCSTLSAPALEGYLDGSANYLDGASAVKVSGNTAFVASNVSDAIVAIDVTTKSAPSKIGQLTGSSNKLDGACGIDLVSSTAYVASADSDALAIIDVETPASMSLLGYIEGSANSLSGACDVAVYSSTAYVAASDSDAVVKIDVSVNASPAFMSVVSGAGSSLDEVTGIYHDGTYAYASVYTSDVIAVIGDGATNDLLKIDSDGETISATTSFTGVTINLLNATESNTDTSFTFEEDYETTYIAYSGGRVDGFNISATANDVVKIAVDFVGAGIDSDGVTLGAGSRGTSYRTGGTYYFRDYPLETEEGGAAFSGDVLGFELDVRTNRRHLRGASESTGSAEIFNGWFEVTGSIQIYYENLTLFEKAILDTESSLRFKFNNSDTIPFVIYLPRVKYNTAELPPIGDAEADPIVNLPFTALYSSAAGYTIAIDNPGAATS